MRRLIAVVLSVGVLAACGGSESTRVAAQAPPSTRVFTPSTTIAHPVTTVLPSVGDAVEAIRDFNPDAKYLLDDELVDWMELHCEVLDHLGGGVEAVLAWMAYAATNEPELGPGFNLFAPTLATAWVLCPQHEDAINSVGRD